MPCQNKRIFESIFFFLCLALFSCEPGTCSQLNCQNDGVCVEGFCECPEGFGGKECEKIIDPCIAKECKNGTCSSNQDLAAICTCDDGYEGELCDESWSAKMLGQYTATENCNGGSLQFAVNILDGPRFKRFTIENFNNKQSAATTAKVVADLINPTVFNISEQPMTFGFVKGSGSFDTDQGSFTLSYTIRTTSDTLSCTAAFSK